MTDLDEVSYYLGMKIDIEKEKNYYLLNHLPTKNS